jgi:LPS export ABC transporter permease LptG
VLKLPSLVVLALPVSGLFAMFLGLGRLTHDREIIALEAAGISLRRVLAPLLVVAVAVAAVDFALYNWGVPSSEGAFQRAYLGLIYRQGAPRLQSDTFFKGPEGEVLYARRYNSEDGSLSEVLVYDHVGRLFRLQDAAVTIISAERGTWREDAWELQNGQVYGIDQDGLLVHTASFAALTVPVQATAAEFFVQSRQPTEMGIGELRQRIRTLTSRGLSADGLILECHRKVAIPLATLVFVLLGGAMSLIFGWRSRAAGIVLSFLLIGAYQGVFLWMGTVGERGILPPALAAWLPNLAFGAVGVALFVRLDRLSSRDWLQRLRRAIPFLVALAGLAMIPLAAHGEEPPVTVESEALEISADGNQLHAWGNVRVGYGDISIAASEIRMERQTGEEWALRAHGDVTAQLGEQFTIRGDAIEARLVDAAEGLFTTEVATTAFHGRSRFENAQGDEHVLVFQGRSGRVLFDEDGAPTEVEIDDALLSTCDCCGGVFDAQPYSIEAGRVRLLPEQLIVAFDLTVRTYGLGVFWLPVYVQPLEETLESPLFPAIGRSALHGWFLKWNVPFFLGERTYGALLFDVYSRFLEVGGGILLHYGAGRHDGQIRVHAFPATVGDSSFDLSLAHDVRLGEGWEVGGELAYARQGERTQLAYAADAVGSGAGWTVSLTARRERSETDDTVRLTERVPELELTGVPWRVDRLSVVPHLAVGWYREWEEDELPPSWLFRGVGGAHLTVDSVAWGTVRITPDASVEATRYLEESGWNGRLAATAGATVDWPFGRVAYNLVRVSATSPLLLDAVDPLQRLDASLFAGVDWHVDLRGSWDLDSGTLDPVRLEATTPGPHVWTLRAGVDVLEAAPLDVSVAYRGRPDGGVIRFEQTINLVTGRWEPLTWSVRSETERGTATIDGELDLETGEVLRVASSIRVGEENGAILDAQARVTPEAWSLDGTVAWSFGASWGVLVGAVLGSAQGSTILPRFGLFRDLEECLRVGMELRAGQVWIYASVLAFPEAIIRYSPTAADLTVGR